MLELINLRNFAVSIEGSQEVNPTIERWLDGAKDLQLELSERVVSLCRYFDQIPEPALTTYASALIDALSDEEIIREIKLSKHLNQKIFDFAKFLEKVDVTKADLVLEAIKKSQSLTK